MATRPEEQGHRPGVLLQAHATVQPVFYDAMAFPEDYRGSAFANPVAPEVAKNRTGCKAFAP